MRVAPSPRGERTGGGALTFVLCTVPSDSHMWNLVALQLLIEEMGHRVVNLGACTAVPTLIGTCRAERPDCVVVSTVNGLGSIDGAALITALRAEPDLAGLPVVIGGKLGLGGTRDSDPTAELRRLGYDGVFPVGASAEEALAGFRGFVAGTLERAG
ncbi:cobalamin B12-binding domain-containing protein [Streptomyces sp. NPDC088789]|uniref:cobalamin B12-binding domain-containing protein n=1 Tax=Streptomyces sp. NPDC088789 TaxID=3365899 RepID=UPI003818CEB1